MHRDDDLVDDLYQGNAYAPFETKARSRAVVIPGYAFYGFLGLVLVGVLAVNALAQTSFAGVVFKAAGSICFAGVVAVAMLSKRCVGRFVRFVRPLLVTIGASAYLALVAGIASILR